LGGGVNAEVPADEVVRECVWDARLDGLDTGGVNAPMGFGGASGGMEEENGSAWDSADTGSEGSLNSENRSSFAD